jgi:hypothetical protein
VGRTYGHNWVASLNAGYSHSAGLTQLLNGSNLVPVNAVFDSVFGGAQVSRRINLHFSGFASYEAQNQSESNGSIGLNPQNGTSHTFAIGITFTPRSTRLGQF